MLKVQNIKKSYDSNIILNDISFEVSKGETVVIIGPSGSGKTTLLRCLNNIEKADSGTLILNGEEYTLSNLSKGQSLKLRRNTSMVFQNYALFYNLTAIENIEKVLVLTQKIPSKEAHLLAKELLEKVGLSKFENYYPSQLSGGQQQRVGIARALSVKPWVILFDEPTSSLDSELVDDILQLIKKLSEDGISMIIVTHELGFAYQVADKVIFIDEGKIVEEGTPNEVIKFPKEVRTEQFLRNEKTRIRNLMFFD